MLTLLRTKISVHAANSKAQATAAARLEETKGIADEKNPLAQSIAQGVKGSLYSAAAVNPAYSEAEKEKFRSDPDFALQCVSVIVDEKKGQSDLSFK